MRIEVTTNGRQAIFTKYYGPTNHKCSRIVASCEAGRVTVPWNVELNTSDNHSAAVHALLLKMEWSGRWRGSSLGDGRRFVFIQLEGYARSTSTERV